MKEGNVQGAIAGTIHNLATDAQGSGARYQQNMTTTTEPTVDQLRQRVTTIEQGIRKGGDIAGMRTLFKELDVANAALAKALDAVEGDARLTIEQTIAGLGPMPIPENAYVQYTLKRNVEDGQLHVDTAVILVPDGKLPDAVYEWLDAELENATAIASIRTITVTPEGVKVNAGAPTKAPKADGAPSGGGRGHGWTRNGQVMQLTAAFDSVATAEQQAELTSKTNAANKASKGSVSFTYKRNVVQKAGFTAAS